MKSIRHPHLVYALLAIALMMFTLITIRLNTAPQIVVFDIEQTLSQYQDQLIEANLGDQAHSAQLATFDTELRRLLKEYAQAHHLVILVPGALISGAPDRTTEIQHYVIEALKKES
ncbi:Conjugal transfer protein [Vibrio chagasii]|nr:Conjugal transfer protein [Vibrio chagasii]CAH6837547.1 Conjugal transfer protein [Vibrio chagasii]CAH7061095.1 Conjugal transfer protein [Vibrio chagasii]CAH7314997.1 Conjugal transfer protein [Vibrio chagasii]CAH7332779.1 Conjugal transfer protein [Vibrio chagasii]